MEKVGAGPLADEALRKLIYLQLQKYEKQLEAALRELAPLERQHGYRVALADGGLEVETFPHHLHDGAEDRVAAHPAVTGVEVLQRILEALEASEQAR